MCIRIADGEAKTRFNPLANNPLCFLTFHAVCDIRINANVRMRKTCPARHCEDFQSPTNDKITPHRVVVPVFPVIVIIILRHPTIDQKWSIPNDILIVPESLRTKAVNQCPDSGPQRLFKQILKSHPNKGITWIIVRSFSCGYQWNVCHREMYNRKGEAVLS